MAAQWTDLVDPTREELVNALPVRLDDDVIAELLEPVGDGRGVRPALEAHEGCVRGVLVHPRTSPEGRAQYLVLDIVASPSALLTARKAGPDGTLAAVDGVAARVDADASVGDVFHGAVDDSADAFLELVDGLYEAIDDLEGEVEHRSGAHVRRRIAVLRNEILLARRARPRHVASRDASWTDESTSGGRSSFRPRSRHASWTRTRRWFA